MRKLNDKLAKLVQIAIGKLALTKSGRAAIELAYKTTAFIALAAGATEVVKLHGWYEVEQRTPEGVLVARDVFPNLVTTVGKNYLLDNGLAGSSFTAAYYLGLIDASGYTAVAAGDTMASHAGWTESTAYTQTNRPTAAWNAASGGSKAFSAALTFTMNSNPTIKGCFLTTNNTKGGTTGTLYSAGLFSGGDQPTASGNTLNVSYTASA